VYPLLSDPEIRRPIVFYALNYDGSGDAFQPQTPPWWDENDYELLFKPNLPQRVTLFGQVISNSSITWENAIYETRPAKQN
jgi:hypothetical protein